MLQYKYHSPFVYFQSPCTTRWHVIIAFLIIKATIDFSILVRWANFGKCVGGGGGCGGGSGGVFVAALTVVNVVVVEVVMNSGGGSYNNE